ncbi:hypothetical protein NM208_g2806 [Fusarium decemcellulare]|uniref:Uncharacterized protein n=1 Tax=Fusarium decemcellulare TaxID=57161 RepID=A0ACC1SRM1_9HYPO|nr:hypothetical protein NM208_g2806 [Fusarium decemcellulare]
MATLPVRTRRAVTPEPSHAESDKFIAIGIDFGTTYSGVSWAFSEQPDQIREISEWPAASSDNTNEVQVPTQYDIKSGKWGYQVTPDMTPIKWFKLLLLNASDIAREEIRNSEQLKQAREQLSERSNNNITAVQVVGYYIKALWEHTISMLKKMLDLDNIPLRVATHGPRNLAALCADCDARYIGATTLDLVQEPEAAGLSIMFERSEFPEIQKGESFVVCDAGGGTVDVISYRVTSAHPFQLKECVKGDGKLSGAFRIDEAFEAHLKAKTKLKLSSLSEAEYNSFFTEDWERRAKRSFSNANETQQFHLRPPSKAYKTVDRWRNKDNLSLSREEMITFFSKSLTGIRTLVSDQYKKVEKETKKPPKKILLVGGLGSSLYVHRVLDELFKGIVLRPLAGWSAVARGAVLRLVRDKLSTQTNLTIVQQRALIGVPEVTSRKSRYNYGIVVNFPVACLNDVRPSDKTGRNPDGIVVTPRMEWYLKKGDEVCKKDPVLFSYIEYCQDPLPDRCKFSIKYSDEDTPPKRNDSTVSDLCSIECDWDLPFSEWTPVGDPSDGWRKYDELALAMRFEGEPKWTMQVGSKETEREVEVKYMS